MQKKRKKLNVFMALKNNNGFSMISMLVTLTIIIITVPFISFLLKNSTLVSQYDDISVQQFFIFIEKDIFNADDAYIDEGELLLVRNDETAIYKFYNGTIRRQLRGGQQIYLRDVKSFQVESISYGCKLIVTTKNGENYEKTFAFNKE